LATRLGVTTRCVRRDVERLRDLGYPVQALRGVHGGYRLGAGRTLPPLLLEDEEAVAVAVALSWAAGGTAVGSAEAALGALAKLDAVMPPRLREQSRAIREATATVPGSVAGAAAEPLLTLARACRDRVRARFGYETRSGDCGERLVEPVRLVAVGRRWYLMAWDVDRADWRTFRLDRIVSPVATTWRFADREHPDPVDFVQRAVTSSPYRFAARILLHASLATARDRVPPTSAVLTPYDGGRTLLEAGADSLQALALHLAGTGLAFEVLEPPELAATVAEVGARMSAAAGPREVPGPLQS